MNQAEGRTDKLVSKLVALGNDLGYGDGEERVDCVLSALCGYVQASHASRADPSRQTRMALNNADNALNEELARLTGERP